MAIELGALAPEQQARVVKHLSAKGNAEAVLSKTVSGTALGLAEPMRKSLQEWARRDDILPAIRTKLPNHPASDEALDDAIYAPYLSRLEGELAARERDRRLPISASFDFGQVPGLSHEMQERLASAGPADLDQAARVPGVTPAALSALHFALIRQAA
jgi:tRNA uridine 5-carboxymethylaminomethyl modification enzyme